MATRYYLQNDTPSYTPATIRGTWDVTSSVVAVNLGRTKVGSSTSKVNSEASSTNPRIVLQMRCITGPLVANVALSGTVSWMVGALENDGAANAFFKLHIWVTQGNSSNLRGTLLADHTGATEHSAISGRGRGESGVALFGFNALAGDRIVVEFGTSFQNASSTSYSTEYWYGNTGSTDLTLNSTNVTTEPGWIEFSQDLFPINKFLGVTNIV